MFTTPQAATTKSTKAILEINCLDSTRRPKPRTHKQSAALGRLCASKTRRVYFRAKEKHSFRPFTRDAMATILSQGAGNRMPHNDDDVKCHELHLPHFYSNRTRRRRCDIDGATNCLQFPLRYSCGIRGES